MFTSQKTFGVNPYFSAPRSGASEGIASQPSRTEIDALLTRQSELIWKKTKTSEDIAELKKIHSVLEKRLEDLKAQQAEYSRQLSETIDSTQNVSWLDKAEAFRKHKDAIRELENALRLNRESVLQDSLSQQRTLQNDIRAAALENFEQTKDNALVARLFGLPQDFFRAQGFGSIKDMRSLQSMMVAVKHALDNGNIPTDKQGWIEAGYNPSGIFGVFQQAEADILTWFAQHIQGNDDHKITMNYILSFADNTRAGYEQALQDVHSDRLTNMAVTEAGNMKQNADGNLEAQQGNIIEALAGNNDKNYQSVDIVGLHGALTHAVRSGRSVENIYQRITGDTLSVESSRDIINARLKFRDAIEVHLGLMKAAGGANAGLDALLQNKGQEYLSKIRSMEGEIQVLPAGRNFSNTQKNILSALLGAAAAFGTGGVLVLNARAGREVSAESVMKELSQDGTLKATFGKTLGAIGNFFLGRNFKLSIGHDDFLRAFKERIMEEAKQVMDVKFDTDPSTIVNPELRKAFEIAKEHGYIKSEADMNIFHKAIVERMIESEARGVQDYKAIWGSINPLFIGMHYDRVNMRKQATQTSEANLIEGRVTAENPNVDMPGVEISPDNKTFTIPSKLPDFRGAYEGEFEVVTKNEKGELIPLESNTITHETPKKLHLTLVTNNGRAFYVVEFTDRDKNNDNMVARAVANNSQTMTAQVNNLASLRASLIENTRNNIGDSIYMMTRSNRYKNFNDAIVAAGQQDYAKAVELLSKGRTNTEKALYNAFKENPEGLATALTFAYGNVNKNHQGVATARQYTTAHPDAVKNAENALTEHNKTNQEMEATFRNHAKHTPTELSDIVNGQSLAVSVYATPRGGRHRIDNFSGSIQVSDKTVAISSEAAKGEIFDRHAYNNEKALKDINAFLGKDRSIDMATLKAWMVSGKAPAALEGMVDKHPQFLEARAMIQGNLCANKTEVMVYPTLKGQSKPQVPEVDGAVAVGTSTVLMNTAVDAVQSGVGVNTVAVLDKLRNNRNEPNKPGTNPRQDRGPLDPNNPNQGSHVGGDVSTNLPPVSVDTPVGQQPLNGSASSNVSNAKGSNASWGG